MSYRVIKNSYGTNKKEVICEFNIPYNVYDFCFIPDFGYLFALRDNHCIAYADMEGKVTISWLGELNKRGFLDGSANYARLDYPSSITYSSYTKKCFLIESGGVSIRACDLNPSYVNTILGKASAKDLKKKLAKISIESINTFCDVNNNQEIYWSIDKINRCYKYHHGKITLVLGGGKRGYSVSSEVRESSLNHPSGIITVLDSVYISDKGNHCIRELCNEQLSILEGTPVETEQVDTPTYLKHYNGIFYFIDKDKVKYFASSTQDRGVIHTGDNIEAIELDDKNVLILEKTNV